MDQKTLLQLKNEILSNSPTVDALFAHIVHEATVKRIDTVINNGVEAEEAITENAKLTSHLNATVAQQAIKELAAEKAKVELLKKIVVGHSKIAGKTPLEFANETDARAPEPLISAREYSLLKNIFEEAAG